jgi:hypothetical protein
MKQTCRERIIAASSLRRHMNPEKFAAAVAVAIFAGGLIGLVLQRSLPEKHTTGPARDMIGAVVGLLTLLCALVTGLLIWTAYGVYAGQNAAITPETSKRAALRGRACQHFRRTDKPSWFPTARPDRFPQVPEAIR